MTCLLSSPATQQSSHQCDQHLGPQTCPQGFSNSGNKAILAAAQVPTWSLASHASTALLALPGFLPSPLGHPCTLLTVPSPTLVPHGLFTTQRTDGQEVRQSPMLSLLPPPHQCHMACCAVSPVRTSPPNTATSFSLASMTFLPRHTYANQPANTWFPSPGLPITPRTVQLLCDTCSVCPKHQDTAPPTALPEGQPLGRRHTATYVRSSAPSGSCFQHRAGRCDLGGLLLQLCPLPSAHPPHTGHTYSTSKADLLFPTLLPIPWEYLFPYQLNLLTFPRWGPRVRPQPPHLCLAPPALPLHVHAPPAAKPAGRSRG